MKLNTIINSERGKEISKSGNEFLEIKVNGENRSVFLEIKITENEDFYFVNGWAINSGTQRSERYFDFEIGK